MATTNIYLCGVGGQGIGLLAEVLAQAACSSGLPVRGCDTHGLAQRHGTVASHLRIGKEALTPRVTPGRADLVVSLERLEALRAAEGMLKRGGQLVYYDTAYQPISIRTGQAAYPGAEDVAAAVAERGGILARVVLADLPDPRMQNVALIGRLAARGAIPGVAPEALVDALRAALPPKMQAANLEVYQRAQAD